MRIFSQFGPQVAAVVKIQLCLLCLLYGQIGSAQSVETPPPVPPALMLPVPETADAGARQASGSGYWIVSSWKSPQSFDEGMLQYCPEVTRFDECVGYRKSSPEELAQSLVPGLPICVFVHGSFMNSPSVCPESLDTWKWIRAGSCGLPFQMIYFSWPSDRPLSAFASIDIAVLGKRASRNGFYLASLIHQLPPESPVCLIGHSHGTRVISSSLHLMAGGEVESYRHSHPSNDGRRIRAVFAASAIDHDWLNPGERYERALRSTECLINLKNCHDPALRIYPLRRIGSSRALGASGFTSKDHQELGKWDGRIRELDVSEVIGVAHLWPNYVERPWLASKLRNYLYFADSQVLMPEAEISAME